MKMSPVSKRAPREEGVEETKSVQMTVRASPVIFEKLRAEADVRGVSVPTLIVYQMGEWLRGGDLDRKSLAGGPAARRERRGDEADAGDDAEPLDWECSDKKCAEVHSLEEVIEAGYRCPKCGGVTGTIGPAPYEPEDEDASLTTTREGMREEPKVPDVLKCENAGPTFGDPCGWTGNKVAAAFMFNSKKRSKVYSCPECETVIAKTRLFGRQDDVLTCPDCKTAYRRDELKEATSWGKDWLVCPGEDCGGRVIEAAHTGKKEPTEKNKKGLLFPWEPGFFAEGKVEGTPAEKVKGTPAEKVKGTPAEKKTGRGWKLPIEE
jgi:ssDNA-binding Zn-finger/Zn-ribbon topoisomerase 1